MKNCATLALSPQIKELEISMDRLDKLEIMYDLNLVLDFNGHLAYNRLEQLVN